jgi:hypothetical protein
VAEPGAGSGQLRVGAHKGTQLWRGVEEGTAQLLGLGQAQRLFEGGNGAGSVRGLGAQAGPDDGVLVVGRRAYPDSIRRIQARR